MNVYPSPLTILHLEHSGFAFSECSMVLHKGGFLIPRLVFSLGVPLIFEAFSWEHGVMVGACVKSEATAAAEFKGKQIMHDPMAMRPFMGYNFGNYLKHWLSLNHPPHKVGIKVLHLRGGFVAS